MRASFEGRDAAVGSFVSRNPPRGKTLNVEKAMETSQCALAWRRFWSVEKADSSRLTWLQSPAFTVGRKRALVRIFQRGILMARKCHLYERRLTRLTRPSKRETRVAPGGGPKRLSEMSCDYAGPLQCEYSMFNLHDHGCPVNGRCTGFVAGQ